MALLLSVDQSVVASIAAVDAHGNPARLDGIPAWTVSDPAILAFTPAEDGLDGTLLPVGPLGTAQLQVRVDAAVGEEVREITGVLDVEVVAGEAVTITITAAATTPAAAPAPVAA